MKDIAGVGVLLTMLGIIIGIFTLNFYLIVVAFIFLLIFTVIIF